LAASLAWDCNEFRFYHGVDFDNRFYGCAPDFRGDDSLLVVSSPTCDSSFGGLNTY
jgi:hypothetical protein